MEGAVTAEKSPRTIRTRIPQKYHAWQKKTAHGPSTGTDFAGPFTRMSHTRAARPGEARRAEEEEERACIYPLLKLLVGCGEPTLICWSNSPSTSNMGLNLFHHLPYMSGPLGFIKELSQTLMGLAQ